MSSIARAQAFPTRPVHFIVGLAAGGGATILARVMGQWLSERLGQQFVIDNRPGAGTMSRPKQSCVRPLTVTRC
jgi:tripartite-type tricarboxylate transporter receptor subunit TctC